MRTYFLMACAVLGLAACASVPPGDAQMDGTLKTFMPKSQMAGIYIYRNEGISTMGKMDVSVDGKSIGQIADKTYLYAEVAPGRHIVTGRKGDSSIGGVEINASPGRLYYVKQASKEGWFNVGSTLSQVDAIEAQRDIKRSSLAVGQP